MKLVSRLDISKCERAVRRASENGVKSALETLYRHSQTLVPRDTGALAANGRVEKDGREGRVVYDLPYALIQHENTDFNHPGGGQAKYLEQPANDPAVQEEMMREIEMEYANALK